MNTGAGRATYANGSFNKNEAVAMVGKEVRAKRDLGLLRAGAKGNIVDFHETLDERIQIVIRWNSFNGAEPLYEPFSKGRYRQFIGEG